MTPEMWFVAAVIVLPLSLVMLNRWRIDIAALFMIVAFGVAQFLGLKILSDEGPLQQGLVIISGFSQSTHKVPRHPGLPGEEHRGFPAPLPLSPFYPPVQIRRGERAQRRGCRKTSVFLSRETGISGNFVGRIKGAKCPFDLQFLTWDFS